MNKLQIAIYAEGGIGDVLLAHQKAWILKSTCHKNDEFTLFCDTENNPLQARVLSYLFPAFYKEIFTIPSKKYKKLIIDSQFGQEEVKGFVDNLPQAWWDKIYSYDKKYNFHIDSLQYLNYPELQWARFFNQFPYPENDNGINYDKPFFLSNIFSATGTEHIIKETWWSDRLILELDSLAEKLNQEHWIIATPQTEDKYREILNKRKNTKIIMGEVEDICKTIKSCSGIIGIDSAWRLIGHFYNKPVITISKNCQSRGICPISHVLRWLPFPELTFPLYASTNEIVKLFEKIIENQLFQKFPDLALTTQDISSILIKRDYKINIEKSILN